MLGARRLGRADVGLPDRSRRRRDGGWYWAALVGAGRPLLHVAEWAVPARADPLLVKAPGLWAEHTCDAPMRQWTVANETYADGARRSGRRARSRLRRADARWRSTSSGTPRRRAVAVPDGYEQDGVVHGVVELAGGPLHLTEVPARRWHRWGDALGPRRRAAGVRPHRAAGAVRVPRRHGRRLGAHPGRLALTGSLIPERLGLTPARAQRPAGAPRRAQHRTARRAPTASSVSTNGIAAASARTMANTPPANALQPAARASPIPVPSSSRRARRRPAPS